MNKSLLLSGLLFMTTAVATAQTNPREFTFSGRLMDATGTSPNLSNNVEITIQIAGNTSNCVVYEEKQTVNLSTSNGYFTIGIGSPIASIKRTVNDPGHIMTDVFRNSGASVSGISCTHNPTAGEERKLLVQVNDLNTGITETLSPAQIIKSTPNALIAENAEMVGGVTAANILKVNTTGMNVLSQNNLESIFTNPNFLELNQLLAGSSSLYVTKPSNSGATLPVYSSTPASSVAGQIWYDSTTQTLKYKDNSNTVLEVGTGGGGAGDFMASGAVPMTGNLRLNGNWLSNDGDSEGLSVTNTGRVGVGTNAPNSIFEVVGTSSVMQTLNMRNNDSVGTNFFSAQNNASRALLMGVTGTSFGGAGLYQPNFAAIYSDQFLDGLNIGAEGSRPVSLFTNNAERMRITAAGNVGIGTTSPARPLQVAGAIRLDPLGVAPTSAANGDIYIDSSQGLRFYDGSTWRTVGIAGVDTFSPYTSACTNGQMLVHAVGSSWSCVAAGDILVGGDLVRRDGSGSFAGAQITANSLRLNNAGSYVSINTPATANYALTLPIDDGTANQFLQTNGSGVLTWAAAPTLTNLTESVNSTTPNTTVPVTRLIATNAATNVDLALSPKGTGALLAEIPDGGTSGNKRGIYSVDWQRIRGAQTQVAGGAYSVIGGGSSNSATTQYSAVLGGLSNLASGQYSSILGGNSNSANGGYSAIIGSNNTTLGMYSTAVGSYVSAGAFGQVSVGRYNLPTGSETTNSWVSVDPLFVVGNGTGPGSESNAMMILKDGTTSLYSGVSIGGLALTTDKFLLRYPAVSTGNGKDTTITSQGSNASFGNAGHLILSAATGGIGGLGGDVKVNGGMRASGAGGAPGNVEITGGIGGAASVGGNVIISGGSGTAIGKIALGTTASSGFSATGVCAGTTGNMSSTTTHYDVPCSGAPAVAGVGSENMVVTCSQYQTTTAALSCRGSTNAGNVACITSAAISSARIVCQWTKL